MLTANRPTQRRFATCLDPDFSVEDLVDEFPDQFGEIDGITEEGDLVYYSTSSCPWKGAPHHDQGVGKGHSCLILGGPSGLGFKCLSGNCVASISDVLNKLHEQTGRRYSGEIWSTDLNDCAKIFPFDYEDDGVPVWLDDPTQLTRNIAPICTVAEYQDNDEIKQPKKSEEIKVKEYETIPAKASTLTAIFQFATRKADHDVARVNPAGQRAYRKEVERILRAKEYRRMIEILGQAMIDEIDVEVLVSATPPVFEDPDGNPTRAGLDVLIHCDHIPLAMHAYTEAQAVAQYEREQGTDFPTTQ
jgi:hypothetical protein